MPRSGILTLVRPGVSLAVGLGSLCGIVFYDMSYESNYSLLSLYGTPLGAMLLCMGSSALNQVQEKDRDKRMRRTRRRPLVTGTLNVSQALLAACLLCLSGLGLFFLAGGLSLLLAGLLVMLCYNGLYTPMKPRTPFALLAGGIAGALPPMTGWIGAGGDPFATPILALFGVFYLWQVPHFWLLAEKHRDDYRRAGFRLTSDILPRGSRDRLMVLWVAAYFLGLAAFLLHSPAAAVLIPLCLLIGAGAGAALLTGRKRRAALLVDLSLPLAMTTALVILI